MPAEDGRRGEFLGSGPAFENLQRRKSREGIREAVLRGSMAIWLLRVGRPMGADGVEQDGRCERYLTDVITKIVNGHPKSQIDDLLPWAYASSAGLKAAA
jgi:hypothetical protein